MEPLGSQAMPCLFDWSSRKAREAWTLDRSPDVNREHQQVTVVKDLLDILYFIYLFSGARDEKQGPAHARQSLYH